jgi:FixJ family two-component response regulator
MNADACVHLVDDDASYRRALARLLAAHGFRLHEFASGTELLAQLSASARGCVIMDLQMPELDGLEVQERLVSKGIALPVVFLTGRGDIPASVRAMRGGAVDFLEKDAPADRLIAAVMRGLAAAGAATATRQRFEKLSERELQVLHQVVRGRMNKQIAAQLGIHERTVKLHRSAITAKLGVRSAAQIATLAREAGLV